MMSLHHWFSSVNNGGLLINIIADKFFSKEGSVFIMISPLPRCFVDEVNMDD